MDDRTIETLAVDARINERLVARGMDPMQGPVLSQVIREAIGETLSSWDALRQWKPERLTSDRRIRAVLIRYAQTH
jgi:hypothetical protein